MTSIEMREITDRNRDAVVALHAGPAQGRFVSSVADSIQEAVEYPEGSPWYRAVLPGRRAGGPRHAQLELHAAPTGNHRFMAPVEAHCGRAAPAQGHRSGNRRAPVELVSAEGATELLVSHVIGEGGLVGFYERLGFVPTGDYDSQGERILRLDLAPRELSIGAHNR